MNFNCNCDVDFVPLYRDDTACIIGTQFIFKKKTGGAPENDHGLKRVPLLNFKQKDYQFRQKLASTGYQRICVDGINQDAILIIDSKLNDQITDINRKDFHIDVDERHQILRA